MSRKIPSKLEAEPIIEAIIEIRVKASAPLSDVLPGLLLPMLGEHAGTIERLPAASVPKQLRDNDPNFIYQPLVRMGLDDDYRLMIGDASVVLVCPEKYPSGVEFKQKAVEVFSSIFDAPKVIKEVLRFSIKYTDFIEEGYYENFADFLKVEASFGESGINELNGFNIQFSIPEGLTTNLVSIITPADVKKNTEETSRKGLVIEVDSIRKVSNLGVSEFKNSFPQLLDELHFVSKKKFFSLLTDEALIKLGASYE